MADIRKGRWTAEIEGDFVVFLIGARVNRPLAVLQSFVDLGGRRSMKHMLDYLTEHPEKGLLGYELSFPIIVQYWRSFEHLEAFAKDKDDRISTSGATPGVPRCGHGSSAATTPRQRPGLGNTPRPRRGC